MNAETIKELRGQIDTLDDQIIALLRKRIHISNTVMRAKPAGQIVDANREEEIGRRYVEGLGSDSTPAKVKELVRAVLGASGLYPIGAGEKY